MRYLYVHVYIIFCIYMYIYIIIHNNIRLARAALTWSLCILCGLLSAPYVGSVMCVFANLYTIVDDLNAPGLWAVFATKNIFAFFLNFGLLSLVRVLDFFGASLSIHQVFCSKHVHIKKTWKIHIYTTWKYIQYNIFYFSRETSSELWEK